MGGSPGSWRNNYHDANEETAAARSAYNTTVRYTNRTNDDLNKIYRILDYEQQRVQSNAFEKELKSLLSKKDIEWKIFEEDVKKAQANYISNLYTNRVAVELQNLREIVNEE